MKKEKILLSLNMLLISSIALGGCGGKSSKNTKESKDLKVWSSALQPATEYSDWKDSPFHKGLEKGTGIKVDWEFPTEGTDQSQAFNLMTSESQLPDIIQYPMDKKADMYIDDGLILDLTDLLPDKAPNYWKFLQDNPDLDRAMKTDSGKYYMFGFFRENVIAATHLGPMIRQDWLEEQNLEVPKTIDDWEHVLQVFNKEYGARLSFTSGRMSPGFAGAFGAYGTFGTSGYVDKNNHIQLAQVQPEWKEYMTWLNKLYKEGLIDPDVITLADSELKTKIANDNVGATITTAGTMTSYQEDANASGKTARWAAVPYPAQANGDKSTALYYDQLANDYGFSIGGTTEGKKLDDALKWLDWGFTEEGATYWNFGTEGESYEMKDGQPEFTDKITKSDKGTIEALTSYTGNVNLGLGMQNIRVTEARFSDEANKGCKTWYNENDEALASTIPKQISYTSEESKELATITNTLDSFISENAMKFMTGERSLDEYDQFVQELKDQNLDRYLEIRQAAFDRYLDR